MLFSQLFSAFLVSLGGSFHFGFQLGVLNPIQDIIFEFCNHSIYQRYSLLLSPIQISTIGAFLVSEFILGVLVGVVIASCICRIKPNSMSIFWCSVFFMIFSGLSATARFFECFELLLVMRFFIGVLCGAALKVQTIYLIADSQQAYQGFVGSVTGVAIQIGLVSSSILGLPFVFGNALKWPWIYFFEVIPALCCAVFMFIRICNEPHLHIDKFFQWFSIPCFISFNEISSYFAGFRPIVSENVLRKGILLGLIANLAISFSGIIVVSLFATHLLQSVGFSVQIAAILNVCLLTVAWVGSMFSGACVQFFGRRAVLVGSCFSLSVLNFVNLCLKCLYENNIVSLFSSVFMIFNFACIGFVFGLGIATIPWFITMELVPEAFFDQAQTITAFFQYLSGFIVPFLFLILFSLVGSFSFLIFIVPLFFFGLLLWKYLPETSHCRQRNIS